MPCKQNPQSKNSFSNSINLFAVMHNNRQEFGKNKATPFSTLKTNEFVLEGQMNYLLGLSDDLQNLNKFSFFSVFGERERICIYVCANVGGVFVLLL